MGRPKQPCGCGRVGDDCIHANTDPWQAQLALFERLTKTTMKIEIAEHKKLAHSMELDVRWGDMDAMGHVNNAVYFRYMESVRVEWMRAVGCEPSPKGQGPVIVNAFCNFYRQLEYPARLLLKLYVSDPARTTFETWTTIERLDQPGVLAAAGGATVIWVDFPAQKAVPLPDWMRQLVL